jgi:hypothetical protein
MRTVIAALSALIIVAGCGSPPSESPGLTLPLMVVLSDGDHAASTYVDGVLAPAESGHRDVLTTVSLRDGGVRTAEVEVSNSVTAAPEVLALSPDGATAFVTERLGPRAPGATRAADLPAGDRVFAVDVGDPDSPRVADDVSIGESPEALAVRPDGSSVAVVSNTPEATLLQIIPWTPAGFDAPLTYDLAGLGITGTAATPRGGVLATNVQWHPDGRALAVNITSQDRILFLTVDPRGAVQPWHEPVTVGRDPFVGRFTPDGRHYLTSDWGRDLAAPTLEGRLPDEPSRVSVIEIGASGTGSPHRVLGSTPSDRSAEGLAVSPDGRWVATVNMRGTALPPESAEYDERASVTLLRRDMSTGALTKVGDYAFDAVLPEGGAFDPSGRYFVATSFEGGGDSGGSGLQIFRVGDEDAPGLEAVQRIELAHGAHHVVFAT